MPFAGGVSDKVGGRYEGLWTAWQMLSVLLGEAHSILLEPPGAEGQGVEFRLATSQGSEYHQVKRQITGPGRWSLAALHKAGVISAMHEKLNQGASAFAFVSMDPAQQLGELVERAKTTPNAEAFFEHAATSPDKVEALDRLAAYWDDWSKQDIWEALRRVEVHTIPESDLRTLVSRVSEAHLTGDPDNATDVLAQHALSKLGSELTADAIRTHLADRGFSLQNWAADQSVVDQIGVLTEMYVKAVDAMAIKALVYEREERREISGRLTESADTRLVVVAGESGSGKSHLLAGIVHDLRRAEWIVLVLRADSLDHVRTPRHVGAEFGLPSSPATLMANLGRDSRVALLIDQLDWVSIGSGRNPEVRDAMLAVIDEAETLGVPVLMGCRLLDLDLDPRFRDLATRASLVRRLGPLPRDVVEGYLESRGFELRKLSSRTLAMLSVPQNLMLVSTIDARAASAFETTQQLYDEFWKQREFAIRSRWPQADWTGALDVICEYMSDRQTVEIPDSLLDKLTLERSALASEGIIVQDRGGFRLFHESFFDYAFARRFFARPERPLQFLLRTDQHLFRRAQIRQVLLYERSRDASLFREDLRALLQAPTLRPHMRQAMMELVGSLSDPGREDWETLRECAHDDDEIASVVRSFQGSIAWLRALRDAGFVDEAFAAAESPMADAVLQLLATVQESAPDEVAEILEPFAASARQDEWWASRFAGLVSRSNLSISRRFFDLFLGLLDSGAIDSVCSVEGGWDFWMTTHSLEAKPEWHCEAIAGWMTRRLSQARARPPVDPDAIRLPGHGQAVKELHEVALASSLTFVQLLAPLMLEAMNLVSLPSDGPQHDGLWRWDLSHPIDESTEPFLHAVVAAIRAAASIECSGRVVEVFGAQPFETAQFLVIQALAATPKMATDIAVDFLLTDNRLDRGWFSPYVDEVARLLTVIAERCSPADIARLEKHILSYHPDWESKASGRRYRGSDQYVLLSALQDRLSRLASRRLLELGRKFGAVRQPAPRSVSGFVESPIPIDAARCMKDGNWLQAIAKYSSPMPKGDIHRPFRGGASQLASVLRLLTAEDPERFVRLLGQLPTDSDHEFVHAILDGLAPSGCDEHTVAEACLIAHSRPGRPHGREIAHLLRATAQLPLRSDLVDILCWYAANDPDDGAALIVGDNAYDLDTASLNCARGAAIHAIGGLVAADSERATIVWDLMTRLADEQSPVMACALSWALSSFPSQSDQSVMGLAEKLLCNPDESVAGSHGLERLLLRLVPAHFAAFRPRVYELAKSLDESVARTAARVAAYAAAAIEDSFDAGAFDSWLAEARSGAAAVLAVNARYVDSGSVVWGALVHSFGDSEPSVRASAAACFRDLESLDMSRWIPLVNALMASPAFPHEADDVVIALERCSSRDEDTVLGFCERYLDTIPPDGDLPSRAHLTDILSILVLDTYAQSSEEDSRVRCLDMVDSMVLLGVYGVRSRLANWDR